jgi:hypothetical protein
MGKTIYLIAEDFLPTPIKREWIKVVKFMTPKSDHSCGLTGDFKERFRREIATEPARPTFAKCFQHWAMGVGRFKRLRVEEFSFAGQT